MAEHARRPLQQLLDDLGAKTPAPGGGAAAAWTLAMAAGLVEMAAGFAEEAGPRDRAAALRAQALDLAETELHAYEPVLDAQRLPKDDPDRPARLSEALSQAAEPPRAIARTAAEVARLGAEVAAAGRPSLEGDAAAGVLLAEAACRAATRLVEINVRGDASDTRLAEAREFARVAAESRARVLLLVAVHH
jgi:formiminotetrahydrofolate cyclodeaminase